MKFSRRSFLAGSSALLANAAGSRAFGKNLRTLNPKKGIGGPPPLASGLLTSWYYDWGLRPADRGMPKYHPSMQFFPMVWRWYPKGTPSKLAALREQHPSMLLGFNEPDKHNQSNMTVEQALDAWPHLEGIATELVSPAAANALDKWMQSFMARAEKRKLRIDSIAVHHYPGPSAEHFLEWLHKVHKLYQRPIWVTEFAVADWKAKHGGTNRYTVHQTAEFMKAVCTEMDKIPWVKGYAWFPSAGDKKAKAQGSHALATSVLYEADGSLTPLGKLYDSL